jgi:hypothetical protein
MLSFFQKILLLKRTGKHLQVKLLQVKSYRNLRFIFNAIATNNTNK